MNRNKLNRKYKQLKTKFNIFYFKIKTKIIMNRQKYKGEFKN